MVFKEISETIASLQVNAISAARKAMLKPLIQFIWEKQEAGLPAQINFICTHNSRRSQFTQIWAQTLAAYFHIDHVACFSGGTETTALYPEVANTLSKTGFEIKATTSEENPTYLVKFSSKAKEIAVFSKVWNHKQNPQNGFAAVMTCDQAADNCPFIPNTALRIPITYKDPKAFDFSEEKENKYRETSLNIAAELCYVFLKVRKYETHFQASE